jgi:hypothetical protein
MSPLRIIAMLLVVSLAGCADPDFSTTDDEGASSQTDTSRSSPGASPTSPPASPSAPPSGDRRSAGAPERSETPVTAGLSGSQFEARQTFTYTNEVLADVAQVTVNFGAGGLELQPSNDDTYSVAITLYGRGATEATARANLDGMSESHSESSGLSLTTSIEHVRGNNNGADIVYILPSSLYLEVLKIDAGSGDLSITGMSGDVFSFSTGSGDHDYQELQSKTLRADAGSGDMTGTGIQLANLDVDTGSGDHDLAVKAIASGTWTLNAGSGEITLEASGGSYDVTASNGSGSIDLNFEGAQPVGKQDDDHQHVRSAGFDNAPIRVTVSMNTGSGDIDASG